METERPCPAGKTGETGETGKNGGHIDSGRVGLHKGGVITAYVRMESRILILNRSPIAWGR